MMKTNNHESLDDQLNRLYQQRKQQLTMPEHLKEQAKEQAKDQAKDQVARKHRKSVWLSYPIWASTITACFVIVVSFYFLPNGLNPGLNNGLTSDAELIYAPPVASVQSQPESINESFSPDTQADTRASYTQADTRASYTQADTAASIVASAPAPKTYKRQLTQTPSKQQYQSQGSAMASKALTDKSLAGSRSFTDKALTKQTTAKQSTVLARLLPTTDKSGTALAKDCDGNIIPLKAKWLKNIKTDDWINIRFNINKTIEGVSKNQISTSNTSSTSSTSSTSRTSNKNNHLGCQNDR